VSWALIVTPKSPLLHARNTQIPEAEQAESLSERLSSWLPLFTLFGNLYAPYIAVGRFIQEKINGISAHNGASGILNGGKAFEPNHYFNLGA